MIEKKGIVIEKEGIVREEDCDREGGYCLWIGESKENYCQRGAYQLHILPLIQTFPLLMFSLNQTTHFLMFIL